MTNLTNLTNHGGMKQISLYEAKTRLSQLVEEAAAGAEVVIAKHNRPLARLVPYSAGPDARMQAIGAWKHLVKRRVARPAPGADAAIADDFHAPDPADPLSPGFQPCEKGTGG